MIDRLARCVAPLLLAALLPACSNWSGFGFDARGPEMQRIREALRLREGMSVADVGAGKGQLSSALASEVGERGRIFATDIDRGRVEALREKFRREKLANVVVLEGGLSDTRLPRGEARFQGLINLSSDWYWELDASYSFTRLEGRNVAGGDKDLQRRLIGIRRWESGLEVEGGWEAHRALLDARKPFHDVLPAPGVAGAGGVGVRQLVDQDQGRPARQRGVQVELPERRPPVLDDLRRQALETFEEGLGLGPAVRLDPADDDVEAMCALFLRGLEHGVGLSHAWGGTGSS